MASNNPEGASPPSLPTSRVRKPRKRVRVQAPTSPGPSLAKKHKPQVIQRSSTPAVPAIVDRQSELDQDVPDDLDEEDDSLTEVMMAIDMRNRDTIGCAYYVASEEILYMMSDIKYGGLEVIQTLKTFVEPTAVLISTRVDETVDDYLNPEKQTYDGQDRDSQFRCPYILDIRPSNEFHYDGGLRKLMDLKLQTHDDNSVAFIVPGDENPYENYQIGLEPGFSNRQGNLLQLSSFVDIESRLSVGCAGALLNYIQRRRSAIHLPGDPNADNTFRISAIEMFALDGVMSLSEDALVSLQILQNDFHPHAHNQGPTNATAGSKEGLSVYGLFHHLARTPQGKHRLRQYFLRPSLDIEVLRERHRTISALLQVDNEQFFGQLIKSLKSIKNMRTVTTHLRKGISNGIGKNGGIKSSAWFSLRSFAYYALEIRNAIGSLQHVEQLQITSRVLECFDALQLAAVGRAILQIVDFPESQEMHRTVVLPGVDDGLDEMKRQYNGLEDMLNHLSREIGQNIPADFAVDMNVIFFPQIGFLISMPINPITETVDYRGSEDAWTEIFHTAERMYFKDYRMHELDESVGDIYADICDKEIEIVHELAQRILEYEAMLVAASDVCAEIDCLTALAQGAKQYKLTCPQMTHENVLYIKNGIHILQNLIVSSCIPNDLALIGGRGTTEDQPEDPLPFQLSQSLTTYGRSMLLLTGPNYSGKSVYLKQNAIIVYLAHVGSFVPAEQAVVGITDQILTRIATRETISKIQSAFMIDLQQISTALSSMTHRSLLVIDEFGKGTNAADGAGLLCGLLRYLLELDDERPKVLGATHFHEIFEGGYLDEHPNLAFGHMDVRMDKDALDVEDQVTYLYKLLPGRSTSSFGTVCAAMNGIDQGVIDRAEELLLLEAQGADLVTACAEADETEREEMERAEEVARRLLAIDLDEESFAKQGIDLNEWLEEVL